MPTLVALRLPLPWEDFSLPNPVQTQHTTLLTGDLGWAWSPRAPSFPIDHVEAASGSVAPGWDLDHVVLLVPDLEEAIGTLGEIGHSPRLRMEVGSRPAAYFRVGPLLEVVESPVRETTIFGIALSTEESLEVVALRWRGMGRDVADPKPAMQPGRRIMTVRATEVGLAVMSADREHR